MKILAVITSIVLTSSCGSIVFKDDKKELKEENESLRQELSAKEESRRAADQDKERAVAELKAAAAEKAKALAELKVVEDEKAASVAAREELTAERRRIEAQLAVSTSDNAALTAELAELEKRAALIEKEIAEKNKLIAKLNESIRDAEANSPASIPLKPFDGIWVAEKNSVDIPDQCISLLNFDSAKATVTSAVVCPDGKAQIRTRKPTDFGVRTNLFPNSLGFSLITDEVSSSCSGITGGTASANEFVVDHSTRSGGSRANFIFALTDSDASQSTIYRSGSSLISLVKSSDCSDIIKHTKEPGRQDNAALQLAAKFCTSNFSQLGCFTTGGFRTLN